MTKELNAKTLFSRLPAKTNAFAGATTGQAMGKKESDGNNMGTFKSGATAADSNAGRTGGSNMGVTSPLRDASARGIISGKGMLTF